MSAASHDFRLQYAPLVAELAGALERNDEDAFYYALDGIARLREDCVLGELDIVTQDIQSALAQFCSETRMSDLAEKEVPDARLRLEHVLKLTDEAAHHTMDLVEQAHAPAERASRHLAQLVPLWQKFRAAGAELSAPEAPDLVQALDAFLEHASADAEYVQKNLKEMILAQGYQDLSGQILRGVMKLIVELEQALVSLVRMTQGAGREESQMSAPPGAHSHGHGPVVPQVNDTGVVSAQDDVDDLLSTLNI